MRSRASEAAGELEVSSAPGAGTTVRRPLPSTFLSMTPSTDLAGIAAALGDDVGRVSCPHMAMVLDSPQELHPALAAFYSLGASRNGWMLHRSLPGRGAADRAGLVAAGLDVEALEAETGSRSARCRSPSRPRRGRSRSCR